MTNHPIRVLASYTILFASLIWLLQFYDVPNGALVFALVWLLALSVTIVARYR